MGSIFLNEVFFQKKVNNSYNFEISQNEVLKSLYEVIKLELFHPSIILLDHLYNEEQLKNIDKKIIDNSNIKNKNLNFLLKNIEEIFVNNKNDEYLKKHIYQNYKKNFNLALNEVIKNNLETSAKVFLSLSLEHPSLELKEKSINLLKNKTNNKNIQNILLNYEKEIKKS
jgi:hypothetical protein